jgi:CheY-like chemotaxis protein
MESIGNEMSEKSILCVDDEAIILISLKSTLQKHFGRRFSYETASNGAEALLTVDELVKEGVQVLVIISDWQMPGMRGDELLVTIKNRYPNIASIMITGHADESAKKRVLEEAGTIRIFDKPWNTKDLIETIEGLLPQNV